ncbi:MAG: hypothetical protein HRU28_15715 [Rhizobiales bacterium]|nr:hypothetical protein [Hyphomicrobiales bacterium]
MRQTKIYKAQSGDNLDYTETMARGHDTNNVAAQRALKYQAIDLKKQRIGEVNKPTIIADLKRDAAENLKVADEIKNKGEALSDIGILSKTISTTMKESSGFTGKIIVDWFQNELPKAIENITSPSKWISITKLPTSKDVKTPTNSSVLGDNKKLVRPTEPAKPTISKEGLKPNVAPRSAIAPQSAIKSAYNLPIDWAKLANAIKQLKNVGIDTGQPDVQKVVAAVGKNQFNQEQFNILIDRMAKAIPIDRLAILLNGFNKAIAPANATETYQTNIDNNYDQSRDERQYSKHLTITNHNVITVTTNAAPAAIAGAIAEKTKTSVPAKLYSDMEF